MGKIIVLVKYNKIDFYFYIKAKNLQLTKYKFIIIYKKFWIPNEFVSHPL